QPTPKPRPKDDGITHAMRRLSYQQSDPQPASQANMVQRSTVMQSTPEPTPQQHSTVMQDNALPRHYSAAVAPPQGRAPQPIPQSTAPTPPKPAKSSRTKLWLIPVIITVVIAIAFIAWFTFGAAPSEEIDTADTTMVVEEPYPAIADSVAADSVAPEPAPAEQQKPKPTHSSYPANHSSYNDYPTSPASNKPQGINPISAGKPEQIQPTYYPNDTVAI
ncbi:MAG: hypothetical protein ACI4AM_08685, partial [Muribaculaceae bacterium]